MLDRSGGAAHLPGMKIPIAIVVGFALVAASILFIGRWDLASSRIGLVRLDRWTGVVDVCPGEFRDFVGSPPVVPEPTSTCEVRPLK